MLQFNYSIYLFKLIIVAILIVFVKSQNSYEAVGFQPSVSSGCASSLISLASYLNTACTSIVSSILLNSTKLDVCTQGTSGVNCFNPGELYEVAQQSNALVPVFRLPNASTCDLCTSSSGMINTCLPLLIAIREASYNQAINYTAFGIENNKSAIQIVDKIIANTQCNASDKASTFILEYQAQVLCASSDTFGYSIASGGYIPGILDMRSLTQCGICGVVPCLSGQLCNGDGLARNCPAGYYCPTTAAAIPCPENHFCPEASTTPQSCSGSAAGSCAKKSKRTVVWIPLFFALLFVFGVIGADYYLNSSKSHNQLRRTSSGFKQVASVDATSLPPVKSPVSIKFENIRLVTGKTVRIAGVSGNIRPGKFTAILGGSGAGKTSLMNVLLGREDRTDGTIEYSTPDFGGKIPSQLLDRVVAFVPQNDVYLREMTVEQLVTYSAKWRLPSCYTKANIDERVEDVLSQLQLQHLRHTVVGGFGSEGSVLSPGDRKKVNIALELVAGPNVLFLDEPTTGIDASSAMNVARIISNLAKTGITCVAVIHQPRGEIFSLMDDMIILIRGGKMAYQGPTEYVLPYFERYGFKISNPKANKTDFLIDITSKPPKLTDLNQLIDRKGDGLSNEDMINNNNADNESVEFWSNKWTEDGESFVSNLITQNKTSKHTILNNNSNSNAPTDYLAHKTDEIHSNQIKTSDPVSNRSSERSYREFSSLPIDTKRPGFLTQSLLAFRRGVEQHFKNGVIISDLLVYLVGGSIMGIVSCGGPLLINAIPYIYQGSCPPGAEVRCNTWIRFEIAPAVFLMCMIVGSVTIPGSIRTFGREKEVFSREAAVGANKLAYFLGKSCSDIPFMAINAFIYMAPLMAIAPWQSPTRYVYAALFVCIYTVTAMGYWLSYVFNDPDAAVLTGTILAILLNLFSGFVPTIGDGPIGQIMYTH
eukprot:gene11779-15760_t